MYVKYYKGVGCRQQLRIDMINVRDYHWAVIQSSSYCNRFERKPPTLQGRRGKSVARTFDFGGR